MNTYNNERENTRQANVYMDTLYEVCITFSLFVHWKCSLVYIWWCKCTIVFMTQDVLLLLPRHKWSMLGFMN